LNNGASGGLILARPPARFGPLGRIVSLLTFKNDPSVSAGEPMKKRATLRTTRDESFSMRTVFDAFSDRIELLPMSTLVPLFHRLHRIKYYLEFPAAKRPGADTGNPQNPAEARNLRLLGFLSPSNRLGFSGILYKPPHFIHPFEQYYSLPGYLDPIVMPHFFRATDELSRNGGIDQPEEFLAFVYMYFLLMHPLPDGNGRVARSLMEYYNKKLGLNVQRELSWYDLLKKQTLHREGFVEFFRAANLPSLDTFGQSDPFPIPKGLRSHLGRMADCLIDWAESVRTGREPLGDRAHVQRMSDGIRAVTRA
jgi:hypothetical protein